MLIRLALLLSILFIALSAILYLLTRDPRYLSVVRQVMRFMVYVLLVFGVLYLLERYGLAAWLVLA